MSRRRLPGMFGTAIGRACLLTGTLLLSPAPRSQAAGPADKPADRPPQAAPARDWTDMLKDIAVGPWRLDVGGSIRLRWEFQDDFNQQRYADTRAGIASRDGFLLQRARLDFTLRFTDDARAYVELQDSRAYCSQFTIASFPTSCPYWNFADLRQAYVEWLHIGSTPFGVKAGRQVIRYADDRVWGPGEWGNVGRYTWDAVKLIADTRPVELHLIAANRVEYEARSFDDTDDSLDVFGAYAMLKGLPCRVDLFWIYKHTSPTVPAASGGGASDFDTHTAGAYVDGKFGGGWDCRGTLAHTFGRRDGAGVQAYAANARLGYTFNAPWKPRAGVEYTYASGDDNPTAGKHRTFDGAMGSVAVFYGRMNLFSWMNIHDYQVSLGCSPTDRLSVCLDWHMFRLAEAKDAWYYSSGRGQRTDPTGRAGADLGQELDIVVRYSLCKHLKIEAGYACFRPGDFMKNTGWAPDADWVFCQAVCLF